MEQRCELHQPAAQRFRRSRSGVTGNLKYRLLNGELVRCARDGLNDADRRAGATEALRAMVDEIVPTPSDDKLEIVLKRNLAAMLAAASPKAQAEDLRRQVERLAHERGEVRHANGAQLAWMLFLGGQLRERA